MSVRRAMPSRFAACVWFPPHASSASTTARFQTFGVGLQDYVDAGARIVTNGSGSVPEDDVTFDGRMTIRVEVL